MFAGRLLWAAVALTALVSASAGTPARYAQLLLPSPDSASVVGQLRPDEAQRLVQSGLSMQAYALYFTAAELLTILILLSVACLIMLGRSDEWMALYVSMILISMVMVLPLVTVLEIVNPVWGGILLAGRVIFVGGLIPLFFLFPSGHFAPNWTRGLAGLWSIYAAIWPFFPTLQPPIGFGRGLTADDAPITFWISSWFLAGVVAQVWRYFRFSNALERQRTKWVVFGFVLLMACFVGAVATLTYLTTAPTGPGYLVGRLAGPSLLLFGVQVMALSFGVSVLRYRLWDIDVLIRRTLQYTVLTALLALAYFATILVLQTAFRFFTGQVQNQLVTVVSTLAIAALFVPLRRRVQTVIDRRFYRRKYDAARALAGFAAAARDEVDLDRLRGQLIAVVADTLQPESAILWLRPSVPGSANHPATAGGQQS
jgi:hypothetical protein